MARNLTVVVADAGAYEAAMARVAESTIDGTIDRVGYERWQHENDAGEGERHLVRSRPRISQPDLDRARKGETTMTRTICPTIARPIGYSYVREDGVEVRAVGTGGLGLGLPESIGADEIRFTDTIGSEVRSLDAYEGLSAGSPLRRGVGLPIGQDLDAPWPGGSDWRGTHVHHGGSDEVRVGGSVGIAERRNGFNLSDTHSNRGSAAPARRTKPTTVSASPTPTSVFIPVEVATKIRDQIAHSDRERGCYLEGYLSSNGARIEVVTMSRVFEGGPYHCDFNADELAAREEQLDLALARFTTIGVFHNHIEPIPTGQADQQMYAKLAKRLNRPIVGVVLAPSYNRNDPSEASRAWNDDPWREPLVHAMVAMPGSSVTEVSCHLETMNERWLADNPARQDR